MKIGNKVKVFKTDGVGKSEETKVLIGVIVYINKRYGWATVSFGSYRESFTLDKLYRAG